MAPNTRATSVSQNFDDRKKAELKTLPFFYSKIQKNRF